jgi:hypothetical protein
VLFLAPRLRQSAKKQATATMFDAVDDVTFNCLVVVKVDLSAEARRAKAELAP